MTGLNSVIESLPSDVRADIQAATYFVLQACVDFGDHVLLASIEDAEEDGYFAIHAGMADRPDSRMMMITYSLDEALNKLNLVRAARPGTRLWLSTLELQTEIKHANLARGVVLARGETDFADDDEWVTLAERITEREADGQPLDTGDITSVVIGTIVDRLR